LVEVIERGEPALMVSHWTGLYWNGQELGFRVFQEVVRRLHARFDHLLWMKLSELARYWAARELTRIERTDRGLRLRAPFACPDFTLRWRAPEAGRPRLRHAGAVTALEATDRPAWLASGRWYRRGEEITACFALPRGESELEVAA
jgi:hypothetical protein